MTTGIQSPRACCKSHKKSSTRIFETNERNTFRRHSIFLATEAVIFVFEGPDIQGLVRELVVDPTRSAAFSVWGPLLDGARVVAQEEFFWNPTSDELHKLRVDFLCEPWWLRLLAFMGERYERFLLETAHLEALDHEGASE